MNITFGAPSGAFGCSNGVQSGVESRTSRLTTPVNGFVMTPPALRLLGTPARDHRRPSAPRPVSTDRHAGRYGSEARLRRRTAHHLVRVIDLRSTRGPVRAGPVSSPSGDAAAVTHAESDLTMVAV